MERKITRDLKLWKEGGRREALLIKGARQVGKTYVVDEFLYSEFPVFLKIDFHERPDLKGIFEGDLSADSLISKMELMVPGFRMVPFQTAIFLDEIQFCPNARVSLKYLASDERIRVIASGSLLGLNYSKVDSYPVGYERTIVLHPMDFEEFLWAVGIEKEAIDSMRARISERKPLGKALVDAMESYYRMYVAVGGMPEAVSEYLKSNDYRAAREVQKKIVEGYRNDIGKYSHAKDRNRIFAVFDSVPSQLSRENKKFMYSKVGGTKPATYDSYAAALQWLTDAGVCLKCVRLNDPNLPLETGADPEAFKLYINDTGLLASMMSEDVAHAILTGDVRTNRGSVIENAVASALESKGHRLYYFSSKNFEIDFITAMRGAVAAIEVKSGNNRRSKSLDSMKAKYGTKRRMKFEITDIAVAEDGVEHYPLFCCQFLDSLYEPYGTVSEMPDAGEVNDLLRKAS
ncbi:MAG: ATP-binding protein [Candidatus Methanomethylophilaceae archaeon]|nr:ATP-binding protein [Candidatus Methanomethylophilaceae archaeon]